MADLLRSNQAMGGTPLTRREIGTNAGKTSTALGKLASLGAGASQVYSDEHNKKLQRQAKNDLINNTINPDLQMHEAAYAQVIAAGTAQKKYDEVNQGIQNGEYNNTSPEAFQKLMLEQHDVYKEGISRSKFTELEAEAYDDFFLKHEATLIAGQAGQYRKTVQFKQGQALLGELNTVANIQGATEDMLSTAAASPKYTMLDENERLTAIMMAGIQSQNSQLMEQLNDKYHFSNDPKRAAMFNTALKATHKLDQANTVSTVFQLRTNAREAVEDGMMTPELAQTYASFKDEKGNALYTGKELENMVAASEGKRLKQTKKNLAIAQAERGQDISTYSPEMQKETATYLLSKMYQQGQPETQVDAKAGELAKLMNTEIAEYKQIANSFKAYDLEKAISDPKEAEAMSKTFERLRVFFSNFEPTDGRKSKYLGDADARYRNFEYYMKYATGDTPTKIKYAANMVQGINKRIAAGLPAMDTTEWDSGDAAEKFVNQSRKGFWSNVDGFFSDSESDTQMKAHFDTLVKRLGADFGYAQEVAEQRATEMLNQSNTFFGGKWQPVGTENLKAKMGPDPDATLRNFFGNLANNQKMDAVLGERADGEVRDKQDYVVDVSPNGDWIEIVDKNDASKRYGTSMDAFKAAGQFTEMDANNMVNIDGIINAEGAEGKRQKNLLSAEADDWYYSYGINKNPAKKFVSELIVDANGKPIKEQDTIPSLKEWSKLHPNDKIRLFQAWKTVNYGGSLSWTDKVQVAISGAYTRTMENLGAGADFARKNPIMGTYIPPEEQTGPLELAQQAKDKVTHAVEDVFKKAVDVGGRFLADKLGFYFGPDYEAKRQAEIAQEEARKKAAPMENFKAFVSETEGTTDAAAKKAGYSSSYDVPFGYGKYDPEGFDSKTQKITDLTVEEVLKLGYKMRKHPNNKHNSSAMGKWQLTGSNIKDLMTRKKVDVQLSDKFSPETQDKFFVASMEKRGLKKYRAGKITKDRFIKNLKNEWEGLKLTKKDWSKLIDSLKE